MKKKIWIFLCIIGVLFACVIVFRLPFTPNYTHSYDVDIDIHGNINQISEIETQLHGIVKQLVDKAENIELSHAEYRLDSDETEVVCFSFRFDAPGTAYSRFLERLTSQNLVGVLELWVSVSDAKLFHVNYNYGNIKGISDTSLLMIN